MIQKGAIYQHLYDEPSGTFGSDTNILIIPCMHHLHCVHHTLRPLPYKPVVLLLLSIRPLCVYLLLSKLLVITLCIDMQLMWHITLHKTMHKTLWETLIHLVKTLLITGSETPAKVWFSMIVYIYFKHFCLICNSCLILINLFECQFKSQMPTFMQWGIKL